MDDKKKILIVGALFVVMLGVGAFQFMGGGGSSPAPAETTANDSAPAEESADAPESSETAETRVTRTASTEGSTNSAEEPIDGNREPGNPDEAAAEAAIDPSLTSLLVLSPRDPFDGRSWSLETTSRPSMGAGSSGGPMTAPPAPRYQAPPRLPRRSSSSQFSEVPPLPVGRFEGDLPPVEGSNGGRGMVQLSPGQNMPSLDDVPYQVNGVMRGSKQAAVFRDADGNQRLVRAGQALDGDTEFVGVDNGKVIVRHRGKVKTLKVDQNSPAPAKSEAPAKSTEKTPPPAREDVPPTEKAAQVNGQPGKTGNN